MPLLRTDGPEGVRHLLRFVKLHALLSARGGFSWVACLAWAGNGHRVTTLTSRSWTRQVKHFLCSPGLASWRRFAKGVILLPHVHFSSGFLLRGFAVSVCAIMFDPVLHSSSTDCSASCTPAILFSFDNPYFASMKEAIETHLLCCRIWALERPCSWGYQVSAFAPIHNKYRLIARPSLRC
jgi:hypothetical protein